MRTIYHVKCTECGRVIGSGFSELTQPDHILCAHCIEEYCWVLDWFLGVKDHYTYWFDKIYRSMFEPNVHRAKRNHSFAICKGPKKLYSPSDSLGNNPTMKPNREESEKDK